MANLLSFVDSGSKTTVGRAAVQRAQSAGMTIADIQAAARSQGLRFGSGAQQYISSASPFVRQYVTAPTNTIVGLSAVQRAQASGMSPADIQAAARSQGFSFGSSAGQYLTTAAPVEQLKINMQNQFERQQQAFNQRLQEQQQQFAQQQQMFQQQLAERQQQAENAQRQLMIGLQQREKQPTEVRMASSGAEQQGLTRRGTSGYFGRRGMRIGSLNVPNTGMPLSPNSNQSNMTGSFA